MAIYDSIMRCAHKVGLPALCVLAVCAAFLTPVAQAAFTQGQISPCMQSQGDIITWECHGTGGQYGCCDLPGYTAYSDGHCGSSVFSCTYYNLVSGSWVTDSSYCF
jgi:hypothetical protein